MSITNVPEFLKRVAEKTGHRREKYTEKDIPTTFSNIVVLPFYGDMRSEFVMSSLLLHRVKELHPSKYFILCSYPGRMEMYPYIDEYWSLQDDAAVRSLCDGAAGFDNLETNKMLFQVQQLNKYFENVLEIDECLKYYKNGFVKEFFDEFKWIIYNLPSIPSSKVEFNRALAKRPGYKVFIHPNRVVRGWNNGKYITFKSSKGFWVDLAKKLCERGFTPVVYQDLGSHDISPEMEDRCVYCTEGKIIDALGAMRTTGCVLDVFSGVSRWASAARTPFIACAERHLYNANKEYEIDDLCNNTLPYRYIFSFPTIIENGYWNELTEIIVNRLDGFIPTLNRDEWPSTAEQSVIAPYALVRKRKSKKIGTRFISIPKI